MPFLTIQLPDENYFLACTIATTVLQPDERNLRTIAQLVVEKGYRWCMEHEDPNKSDAWWKGVEQIEKAFDWRKFLAGDPITARVEGHSLEFGSIGTPPFGGGCHRTIALAAAIQSKKIPYRPFSILLHCP
jgi:hypothetical protein